MTRELTKGVAAMFLLLAVPALGLAEDAPVPSEDLPIPVEPSASQPVPDDYCSSFVDEAAAARAAYNQKMLQQSKGEIEKKLEELKAQTAELSSWIEKRDAIRADVSNQLVKIYTQMESAPAAAQIEKLTPDLAAELVRRLKPDVSAEILANMEPATAAKLVKILTFYSPKEKTGGT
jgi:flagellar motility protein MotE (MotC chaperone)